MDAFMCEISAVARSVCDETIQAANLLPLIRSYDGELNTLSSKLQSDRGRSSSNLKSLCDYYANMDAFLLTMAPRVTLFKRREVTYQQLLLLHCQRDESA